MTHPFISQMTLEGKWKLLLLPTSCSETLNLAKEPDFQVCFRHFKTFTVLIFKHKTPLKPG